MRRMLRVLLLCLLFISWSTSHMQAAVFYVNSSMSGNSGGGSWGTAMKDIQAAINAAVAGDTIWVKAGTYLPTLDPNGGTSQRDKTFYLTTKDVKLYGGFAGTETLLSQRNAATNITTLSGDLDAAGNNDAYHVVLTNGRTSACVLDGFTITGGRGNVTGTFGAVYYQYCGAGMCNYSGNPVVSNCTFSGNTAFYGGGMYNTGSSPAVSNCIFSANSALTSGGGIFNTGSSPAVNYCVFSGNTANYGGGMINIDNSNSTITSCVISGNTATSSGGGMFNDNSIPVISSSTFSANTATSSPGFGPSGLGGGIYMSNTGSGSGGTITNSIFFGNTTPNNTTDTNRENIYKAGTPTALTVSYSIIGDYSTSATNNYTATNILTSNPLFVNSTLPAGADGIWRTLDDGLRISCASPARDAGTGTTPANDILGNARVGAIDLGAYEVDASCPNILYVDGSRTDNSGNGYSWANAKKDVQAAINAAVAGGEVWVKAGTYLPTLAQNGGTSQQDKTFYLTSKDVKLYGGFVGNETLLSQRNPATNVTTLSGDLDGPGGTADAYHVVMTIGRTAACVVDGFTISGGWAKNSGNGVFSRYFGGGMYNSNSNPVVSNCTFSNNRGGYGGGMYNYDSNPAVSNCTFSSNTAADKGGGMYNDGSSPTVSSCVFASNTAGNSSTPGTGGGMGNDYGSGPAVSNCVFSANTASDRGGGLHMFSSTLAISNCVFSANTASALGGGMYVSGSSFEMNQCTFSANKVTNASGLGAGIYLSNYTVNGNSSSGTIFRSIFSGNTTPNNTTDANRENIYKSVPNTQNPNTQLNVFNSLSDDFSYGATNNYTAGSYYGLYMITANPLFVNAANPAGADGVFGTSDDGLRISCASLARDIGRGPTTATDILGNARLGEVDLGAYEYQGSPADSLPAVSSTYTRFQLTGGTTVFGDCGAAIARVLSTGAHPVTGNITAKVYVQSTAPTVGQTPYVRRHYDISPANNAAAATAQITLYFSQADFDNYNAVRGSRPSLPVNTADAAGYKTNLQITQKHGTSATGLPGSYSGSSVLIIPSSVVWNATDLRWEVTFPVTGFSGFFAHTGSSAPLPLKLLAFGAQRAGEARNRIEWQTAEEEPATRFSVERSSDAKTFSTLGTVAGKDGKGNSYQFYDEAPLLGANYYRLQIMELGNIDYSQTVMVRNEATAAAGMVTAAPNPATDRIVISCSEKSWQGREALVLDAQGRVMVRFVLAEASVLEVAHWPAGIYLLRLPNGSSLKLFKQ